MDAHRWRLWCTRRVGGPRAVCGAERRRLSISRSSQVALPATRLWSAVVQGCRQRAPGILLHWRLCEITYRRSAGGLCILRGVARALAALPGAEAMAVDALSRYGRLPPCDSPRP